jgi:hypothetical protein
VQASNVFYAQNHEPLGSKPVISEFQTGKGEHYCVEEILRISQKPSENYDSLSLKKYNFLPKPLEMDENERGMHKPGFKLLINNKSSIPLIKVEVL